MVRVSSIDAQKWVCKLKHKNIMQFEYKDLPDGMKNKAILHRAKGEGLIISIGKGNGRHLWRITDNIKCNGTNDKEKSDKEKLEENSETKKIENNKISDRITS